MKFNNNINRKLDIREWKEKDRALAEKINKECKEFTFMHYSQLLMTKEQHKNLAKFWGLVEQEGVKGILYKTDKGYLMEVEVNDK